MDIFDYIKKERRTFARKKFNILDSIVLSKMSYLKFEGMIPKEGILLKDLFKAEYFDDIFKNIPHNEEFTKLFTLAVLSPRYRDIKLKYYVDDKDIEAVKQFAAVSFIFDDKVYVSYRGTDSSIIAWHENFQMTFTYPIEAQKQAEKYLEKVYKKERKKLIVGGHSKGGNLAIYAAFNASDNIKKKIINIYSLDGPGFPDGVYVSDKYKSIRKKIIKVIPKESIIGIMFEQDEVLVCKSIEKGILQHEPMFWEIKDDDLVYLKHVSKSSVNFNNIMVKWIETATIEERELFVNTLFSLIESGEVPNLYSKLTLIQKTPKFIKSYSKLEPDRKEFISNTFRNLFKVILGREDDKEVKEESIAKI